MIKIDDITKKTLINLYKTKGIGLEGNITKLIDAEQDEEFKEYLKNCQEKEIQNKNKKNRMSEKVQKQNDELSKLTEKLQLEKENAIKARNEAENARIEAENAKIEAEHARLNAENAKQNALNDLDVLQKTNQTHLMTEIVKVALFVIIGVGVLTTVVYLFTLITGKDTQVIGATWANIFGILLTNAFSIVGTIMGIKYATENKQEK